MIYGYARVSTKGQAKDGNSLEAQEQALRANGAEIVYSDSFTGTKTDRPELSKLLDSVQPGDTIIVAKLDRIARSVTQGIELVDSLLAKDVTVNILNMGTLNNTTTGKLIRNIMFSFAEFERDMIVQRTQEGKAIARTKEGYREGRPKAKDAKQRAQAVELLKDHSYKEVSELLGLSKSTLIRYKREATASAQ